MSEDRKPYSARRAPISAPTGGHLPPQALDLEAAVLGAALLEAHAQRTLLATVARRAGILFHRPPAGVPGHS
jgi:replicative DNA helicase